MTKILKKRLYRSRTNKILTGVCGGLGDYFDIDPIWLRVGFLVTLFISGLGLLVYLIMWLIVPKEPINHIPTS